MTYPPVNAEASSAWQVELSIQQPQNGSPKDEPMETEYVVRRLPRPAQKTLSELVLAIVGSRAPKLLITLTAVQLLVLIVGVAKEMGALSENPSIGPSRERLRQMGALDITKIVEGEWWRWISSSVILSGFLHLVINFAFEVPVALFVERAYGFWGTAVVYIVTAVTGAELSLVMNPLNPICNASSGIFGLWGVLLVDVLVHRHHHMSRRLVAIASALAAVVTAIIFGLLPFVDYFGPLAALVAGVLLSPSVVYLDGPVVRVSVILLLSLGTLFLLMFLGFVAVYAGLTVPAFCPSCRYLACLPVSTWCE